MLFKNITPDEGLINGATGVVKSVDEDQDGYVATISIYFFHLDRLILVARCVCHSYLLPSADKIFMFQFPVMLAWGTTAHKSQGQTLDRIAVNIADPAFAHGALYVALSRVRSLNDVLHLPEWPPEGHAFHVNAYIHDEMSRLTDGLPF